jgi:hypothetical protein
MQGKTHEALPFRVAVRRVAPQPNAARKEEYTNLPLAQVVLQRPAPRRRKRDRPQALSRYLTAEFVSSTLFPRFELTGSAAHQDRQEWELRHDAVG